MQIPQRNYRKIAIICGCTLVGGLIFAHGIFPFLLRVILQSQVKLKPGTEMREMYDELPFPLIFKVHLFHVDNPQEVHQGGKPHLREIGPFVFEEWRYKYDHVDDDDTDTVEFTEKKVFIFSPERTLPLTGDEVVTMIHPLAAGIPLTVNVDRAPMLPMIAKAVDLILHSPQDIFWTGRAMDIIFDGILLDCTSTDFNSKAACSAFDGDEVKSIWPVDEPADHFKFAIFGGINGTDGDRFKTSRGSRNLKDLGRLVEFREEPELDMWDGDYCNTLRGTEGSIFPPFHTKEEPVWAFEAGICRSMSAVYVGESRYDGLPTSHYNVDIGDIASDEEQHCYCPDGRCPPNGTMDLLPCLGTPVVASMPHFLNADPKLTEAIASGMHPDPAKHMIFFDMETISGTPLSGAKRVQINMVLQPLQEMSYMQTVPEMLFPMMWIEEGVNLNKTYVNMLKYQLFLGLKIRATIKWLCIIVGTVGTIGGTVLHFKMAKSADGVTPIQPIINAVSVRSVGTAGSGSTTKSLDTEPEAPPRY